MNFLFFSYKFALKKYLNKQFLCLVIIYIFILSMLSLGVLGENNMKISIGVVPMETKTNIYSNFVKLQSNTIVIKEYSDIELLKKDVILNKIQTGYVIYDLPNKIDVYTSDFSISSKLTNVSITAIVSQYSAGNLGYEILSKNIKDIDKLEITNYIQNKTIDNLQSIEPMVINYKYVNTLPLEKLTNNNLLYVYITIGFCLLISLIIINDLLSLKKQSFYTQIIVMKVNLFSYYLGSIIALFTIISIIMLSVLLLT